MTLSLPITQKEIICEIVELTGLSADWVEQKVSKEFRSPNSLIVEEAFQRKIDFFIYNEKMEAFYKETESWIFSLMVDFCRKPRQKILQSVTQRVEHYLDRKQGKGGKAQILLLGDGVGSDTIHLFDLCQERADFYYFDVPGSKTFDFAIQRFKKYKVYVQVLTKYRNIPKHFFDMAVCLEVLEHLPDPLQSIKDISDFLKPEGIALVSEFFSGVFPEYPTHLRSNLPYAGRTPFLFLSQGLCLTYFCKRPGIFFKPMEFTKRMPARFFDRLRVLLNPAVLFFYALRQFQARKIRF